MIFTLESIVIYFLSILYETTSEKSGKMRVVLQKFLRNVITNTNEVADQDHIERGLFLQQNLGHFYDILVHID